MRANASETNLDGLNQRQKYKHFQSNDDSFFGESVCLTALKSLFLLLNHPKSSLNLQVHKNRT